MFSTFFSPECTTDYSNVGYASVFKSDQCVAVDVAAVFGDSYYTGLYSYKIEDCGQNVYFYNDDSCEDHRVGFDESWLSEEDFSCDPDVWVSWQSFCPATARSKGKGKKIPRERTFSNALALKIEAARNTFMASHEPETQAASPMGVAAVGAFVGLTIGLVATAKYFKSRNQFEGVEMRSTHSSFE